MYNGAWDYGADVRGYTWGWVHEFHTKNWSLRYGSGAMPKVANGLRFDRRLFRDRSDVFEGEYRFVVQKHPGAVRFTPYVNHANAGTYREAIQLAAAQGGAPDVTATRRLGTMKYGIGANAEQELTKDIGIFGRLGWNDGKTESFAFTAIDRLARPASPSPASAGAARTILWRPNLQQAAFPASTQLISRWEATIF